MVLTDLAGQFTKNAIEDLTQTARAAIFCASAKVAKAPLVSYP